MSHRGLDSRTVCSCWRSWWVWASYAWLTNSARSDPTLVAAVVLVAIAALFLAALSVPNAFGSHRRLFAVALFVVVAGFVALFAVISRNTPDLLAGVLRMAQTVVLGAALILVGAFLPAGLQPAIWAIAIAIGLFGPEVTGARGWRVHPAHFAERHALILIIAIGESFSAIGFGARSHLDAGVATASVLGLLVAASFWLAYFGVSSRRLEILLTESRGSRQIAVAREGYTYGHLPLAGGLTTPAFGSNVRPDPRVAGAVPGAASGHPRPGGRCTARVPSKPASVSHGAVQIIGRGGVGWSAAGRAGCRGRALIHRTGLEAEQTAALLHPRG